MPVKRFWLLSQNVDRIEAQRAVRDLTVINGAETAPQEVRDGLLEEVGLISTGSAQRDENAFKSLKELGFVGIN